MVSESLTSYHISKGTLGRMHALHARMYMSARTDSGHVMRAAYLQSSTGAERPIPLTQPSLPELDMPHPTDSHNPPSLPSCQPPPKPDPERLPQ